MDDFDHLLGGRKRRKHFLAHGLFSNVFDQLLDDSEMNVGLEQSDADLPQSGLHVLRRELPFAAQVLEDPLQLFRKIVEHEYRGLVQTYCDPGW